MEVEQVHGHMPRTRDEKSGQYVESYPPEQFIDAITDRDGMASTPEIIETVGCSNRLALDRLRALEAEGRVTSRKVGNAYLWMVSDE